MKIGSKLLTVAQRIAATTTDLALVSLVLGGSLALLVSIMAHNAHIDMSGPFDAATPGLSWTEGAALSLAPYFLVLLPLVWLIYEATLTRTCQAQRPVSCCSGSGPSLSQAIWLLGSAYSAPP